MPNVISVQGICKRLFFVACDQVKKSIDDRILEDELLKRMEEAMKAEAYKEDLMIRDTVARGGNPPVHKRVPGVPHTKQWADAQAQSPEKDLASINPTSETSPPIQGGDGPSDVAAADGALAPSAGAADTVVGTSLPIQNGNGLSGAALANGALASSSGAADMTLGDSNGHGTHIDPQPSLEPNGGSAAPGVLPSSGVGCDTTVVETAGGTAGQHEPAAGAVTQVGGVGESAQGGGNSLALKAQELAQDGRGVVAGMKNAPEDVAGELGKLRPGEEEEIERLLAERRARRLALSGNVTDAEAIHGLLPKAEHV